MSFSGWVAIAVYGGAVAAVLAVLAARFAPALFGPVFRYELVALARRGQQPRLRALLVGLLLVGLLVTYLREARGNEAAALTGGVALTQRQSAAFAETFLVAFLAAQLVAVVLIAPAAAGGAITEEVERGTLDHLRASLLTDREIVLGKLAARLAFVAGVVLAGLPVLMLAMLFGGIDVRVVAAGYAIAGMTAVSLGAYSLYHATTADGLRVVLFRVYGAVGLLTFVGGCCGCVPGVAAVSPLSALGYTLYWGIVERADGLFWTNLGVFLFVHWVATVVLVHKAVGRVRAIPERRRVWGDVAHELARPYREALHGPQRGFTVPWLGHADPLLWKELHFAGRLSAADRETAVGCGAAVLAATVFGLGMTAFIGSSVEIHRGTWTGQALTPVLRVVLTGGAMALGLVVGVRAAASVARERQEQTLDGLLTLPVDRAAVLRAKWVAPLVWVRPWLWAVAAVAVAGGALLAAHPVGLAVAVAQAASFLVFADTLGLWLSVRCRTVVRATVLLLVGLMGAWIGPLLLAPLVAAAAGGGPPGRIVSDAVATLSLPVGVWTSLMTWQEYRDPRLPFETVRTLLAAAVTPVLYAAAVALMRRDAVRVFEREGKE